MPPFAGQRTGADDVTRCEYTKSADPKPLQAGEGMSLRSTCGFHSCLCRTLRILHSASSMGSVEDMSRLPRVTLA